MLSFQIAPMNGSPTRPVNVLKGGDVVHRGNVDPLRPDSVHNLFTAVAVEIGGDAEELIAANREALLTASLTAETAATVAAMEGKKQTNGRQFEIVDIPLETLFEKEIKQHYHISGVIAHGYHGLIAGRFKALKTSIMLDAAISVSSGRPFLNQWHTNRANVGVLIGEGGLRDIQDKVRRISVGVGIEDWRYELDEKLFISDNLPAIANASHLEELKRWITENVIKLCFIDPTYLAMAGITESASNLIMGDFLSNVSEAGAETDCTMKLCHHLNRTASRTFEIPQIGEIVHAGFPEWTAQTILLGPRENWDQPNGRHKLWMNVESRAGHAFTKALTISEGSRGEDGTGERHWHVEAISGVGDAKEESNRKEAELRADVKKRKEALEGEIIKSDILKFMVGSNKAATKTRIRDNCGHAGKGFDRAFADLLREGKLRERKVVGGNRQEYDGYERVFDDSEDSDNPNGSGNFEF